MCVSEWGGEVSTVPGTGHGMGKGPEIKVPGILGTGESSGAGTEAA